MNAPLVLRSYPAIPVAKFDSQRAADLTSEYMRNAEDPMSGNLLIRNMARRGFSRLPQLANNQQQQNLLDFQYELNSRRDFTESAPTSQNYYLNNVIRNIAEHGMLLTPTIEDALWSTNNPDQKDDSLLWHYDLIARSHAPIPRLFGATHMAAEVLIGHMYVPKSIADQCSAGSCKPIIDFLLSDDGQAAVDDGLDAGRLYPQEGLEPGDIIVINGIHRKSHAIPDVTQEYGDYRLSLVSGFSAGPDLPRQLGMLSAQH